MPNMSYFETGRRFRQPENPTGGKDRRLPNTEILKTADRLIEKVERTLGSFFEQISHESGLISLDLTFPYHHDTPGQWRLSYRRHTSGEKQIELSQDGESTVKLRSDGKTGEIEFSKPSYKRRVSLDTTRNRQSIKSDAIKLVDEFWVTLHPAPEFAEEV